MAINPETQYPGKIQPASTDYPYGGARNITVPGDGTGTPWEAALVNDIFGFQQALLTRASIVPTGNPETAETSQYLTALLSIIGSRAYETIADLVADEDVIDGARVLTFDGGRFETWTVGTTGDVALDNGLFATRTQSRIYSTLADLTGDATLREGEQLFTFFSGTDRAKNGRTLYRVMDLSTPNTETLPDGAQIIELDNGLYAVASQTTGDSNIPLSLSRINMHFQALKGIPWNANEAGGSSTYTLSTTVNPGALSVTLDSVTDLVADQLICYKADTGLYHSTVIRSIVGNTLNLRTPIESTVTAGGNFHNFYVNSSHANPFGFYAITDYALKELSHTYRKVVDIPADGFNALTGNETLTLTTDEDIYAPGSASNEYLRVTTSGAADEGVSAEGTYSLPEGQYLVRAYINPGSTNAGADENEVQLSVSQSAGGVTQTVAQEQITGHDCVRMYEFLYYARQDSTQKFNIRQRTAATGEFEVGKIEVFKVENTITNLDNSKHVMLGDSWFAFGDIQDRITDRLPNAVIFQEGAGGNTAAQVLSRFEADAASYKPDYVWIMSSTNDYFQDVSLATFEFNMNTLKQRIVEIGAIPIFFDPSVGEIDNVGEPQNFDRSREYALKGTYSQSDLRLLPDTGVEVVEFFVDRVITAGSTNLVYMPPGTSGRAYRILNSFFNDSSFNVQAGFRSSIGVPNEDVETYVANTLVTPSSAITVGPPTGGNRFITVAIENTAGTDLRALGYIRIEYFPV